MLKDENLSLKWGSFVWVKKNLIERLRHDLRHRKHGVVGVGTTTDPYQPVESKLELTRSCIKLLTAYRFPVSIQTKSTLILRDLDLIKPEKFDVGITITTVDVDLAKKLEPKASTPDARIQIIEEMVNQKIETWIFLGPIIPFINDGEENFRNIIKVAWKNKSKILYDKLNLKKWVLESLKPFLEIEKPELAEKLPEILSSKSGYWLKISKTIQKLCREKSVECKPAFPYI